MYMVKQVATLTGVPEATLRVWERRYGIVSPQRSPGGYRLYDESQLQTLRRMAALVAGGVPASRAAKVALAATTEPTPLHEGGLPTSEEFLDAVASLDSVRLAGVIGSAVGAAPFDEVAQQWIQPRLVDLGHAWEIGRISVAQEHFASASLMRAMAAVFERAQPTGDAGAVLVGLPSGDHHQLVLMAFAICLRERGIDVAFLGADVPLADWVQAAQHSQARAAVIGVTHESRVAEAQKVVDRLRQIVPPLGVWAGGSRRGVLTGATRLPDGVSDAAADLDLALSGGLA